MKILNPAAVAADAQAPHVKHRAAVLDAITASGKVSIDFSVLREMLPKATAAELADGDIHQIAVDAGLTVCL